MDDVQISADDRERIEDMVTLFRSKITNLYRMAFMAGQMHSDNDTVAKLRAAREPTNAERFARDAGLLP